MSAQPSPDERSGVLTAAGIQAAATHSGPGDVAVYSVLATRAGGTRLELRATSEVARDLLSDLEPGQRVEVRLVPCLDLADGHPLTRAGESAGWGL